MASLAFERMRLQSHARIRRLLADEQVRFGRVSTRVRRKLTCQFYAHSPFLLCAVNPSGPCECCPHYLPGRSEDLAFEEFTAGERGDTGSFALRTRSREGAQ